MSVGEPASLEVSDRLCARNFNLKLSERGQLSEKAQPSVSSHMDTVMPALKLGPQAALAAVKPTGGRTSRVLELEVVFLCTAAVCATSDAQLTSSVVRRPCSQARYAAGADGLEEEIFCSTSS